MTGWGSSTSPSRRCAAACATSSRSRGTTRRSWPSLRGEIEARPRAARSAAAAEQRELDEARRIQRKLLPAAHAADRGLGARRIVAAGVRRRRRLLRRHPLRRAAGSRLSIADVVGKGIPAALLMSNLQAAVRAFATEAAQPAELCQQVNRILCGHIAEGRFISFFYCVVDADAGHADVTRTPGTIRRCSSAPTAASSDLTSGGAGARRLPGRRLTSRRRVAIGSGRSARALSPTASPKRATRPTKSSARTG